MCPKRLLFIYYVLVSVKSENENRRYEPRKGKLFSFNTLDEDLTVDLDFSIPFLTIPIKKAMNSAFGFSELPTININPASLALGGVVIFGSTILLPLLLKSYNGQYGDERYSRLLDSTEFSADAVISFANQMITNKQGLHGCAKRVACWTGQRDFTNPDRILNQIMNNRLLSTMINTTAIQDAMLSGRNGRDCMNYAPCPLREHHIPMLMNNLAVLTKAGSQ